MKNKKALKIFKQNCNICGKEAEKVFMLDNKEFVGIAGIRCKDLKHNIKIDLEEVLRWRSDLCNETKQMDLWS